METKSCNLCKANFNSRFELKHHMLRIHNETKYLHEYDFVCTICDVAFDRIESLQNHLENYAHHQRNKIFEPKRKNENNFKVSQTPNFVAEDRPKSTRFPCFLCKKIFYRQDYIIWHLSKKHSVTKPIKW